MAQEQTDKRTGRRHDAWKQKIKAGVLADRLFKHAQGTIEMTQTQINAAKILLNKLAPDLRSTEISGEMEHRIKSIEVVRKE